MSVLFSSRARASAISRTPLNDLRPRWLKPRKMGMKIVQPLWTMGAYDVAVLLEAPNDEAMSAFTLKIGSMGSVKTHTMRAFTKAEMESILEKIK
jgi:uncharacterized protein with GYD domain